ncbi:MAG: hypothetical protein AB1650_09125 [Candidatus Omnitrophota bacterium]
MNVKDPDATPKRPEEQPDIVEPEVPLEKPGFSEPQKDPLPAREPPQVSPPNASKYNQTKINDGRRLSKIGRINRFLRRGLPFKMPFTMMLIGNMDENLKRRLFRVERAILDTVLKDSVRNFDIVLSTGEYLWSVRMPQFRIRINNSTILPKLVLLHNDYVVGKAFIEKEIDLHGDIIAATAFNENFLRKARISFLDKLYLLNLCLQIYWLNFENRLSDLKNDIDQKETFDRNRTNHGET